MCAPTTAVSFPVTYTSVVFPTSTITSTSTSATTSVFGTVRAREVSAPEPSISGLAGVSYVAADQLAPPSQLVGSPVVVVPGAQEGHRLRRTKLTKLMTA